MSARAPNAIIDPAEVNADLFWSKVQISEVDKCWLWTAAIGSGGYGCFHISQKQRLAHRVSYTLVRGEIPEGLTLDHLCRVRHCVNPSHLEPVSIRINTLRGNGPSSVNSTKTHCPEGHEYDSANTSIKVSVNGAKRRRCSTCHRNSTREYMRKQRASK